jgi:hypothetical protein
MIVGTDVSYEKRILKSSRICGMRMMELRKGRRYRNCEESVFLKCIDINEKSKFAVLYVVFACITAAI